MGKLDNVDKDYFLKPARAAELFTVGIHHKHLRIDAQNLKSCYGEYPSLITESGRLARDGFFVCSNPQVKYGLEIESDINYSMPRRIMTYDACDYDKQAATVESKHRKNRNLKTSSEIKSGVKKDDLFIPVITLVLYVGIGKWDSHLSILDTLHIKKEERPYIEQKISNYSFPILEADVVNPNDFKTDLRIFFKAMQCRQDKNKFLALLNNGEFENLPVDLQKALAVHMNEKILINKVIKEGQEMCKAMREWVADEKEISKQEGIAQGKNNTNIDHVRNLIKSLKCTVQVAFEILNIPEDEQPAVLEKL